MPKISSQEPPALRPYIFHGLDLPYLSGDERVGECPFCGKEKLHINPVNGLFSCKVCGEEGNTYNFLRKLHQLGMDTTPEDDYLDLMENRGILLPESIIEWGVCKSPITDEWLLPAYNVNGELSQLYKFVHITNKEGNPQWVTYATPKVDVEGEEIRHQLFGAHLLNQEANTIYICEGFWDGVVWWETLLRFQQGKIGPKYTENKGRNYLADSAVVAVPGSQTFRKVWCSLFAERDVVFLYDNDHPRKHERTGHIIPPSGLTGTKKAIEVLMGYDVQPKSYHFLRWGNEGYNLKEKDGLDVRDILTQYRLMKDRGQGLSRLLSLISPIPQLWLEEIKDNVENACKPVHCTDWKVLVNAWKLAMRWVPGLDYGLSFAMAIAASTELAGDQIWGKMIGPPSTGKSTLCEALSVSKRYVYASSTFRGFYSGYKTDKEGLVDHSTITKIKNKTLVIKDGDTLLTNKNRDMILSQARDLYDRVSRADYSNALNRKYEGYNVTLLLCGTSSLRELDTSELGQRCIDCVIMDDIDEDLELSINRRKQNQIRHMFTHLNNGASTGRDGETQEMMNAKSLTAGYLEYLRNNIRELGQNVAAGMSDKAMDDCNNFGMFIAYFRSRPPRKQDEDKKTRELSTRLVSQLTKMAYLMAVVMGKKEVDGEVMQRIHKITLDTARGNTLNITRHIVSHKETGLEWRGVAGLTGLTDDRTRDLLRFLKTIGVLETFKPQLARGVIGISRYRMTDKIRRIYNSVMYWTP